MVSIAERYAAALLGFGFVVVALTTGFGTAVLAVAGGAAAYGLTALRQRRRLDRFTEEFLEERTRRRAPTHPRRERARRAV